MSIYVEEKQVRWKATPSGLHQLTTPIGTLRTWFVSALNRWLWNVESGSGVTACGEAISLRRAKVAAEAGLKQQKDSVEIR